jgi:hypothetical protein
LPPKAATPTIPGAGTTLTLATFLSTDGERLRRDDVAVVPDGVAQVRWTFGDIAGKPGRVVDAPAADNVAVVPYVRSARGARLVRAAWFASNGRVIPTSDKALLRAIAAGRQC